MDKITLRQILEFVTSAEFLTAVVVISAIFSLISLWIYSMNVKSFRGRRIIINNTTLYNRAVTCESLEEITEIYNLFKRFNQKHQHFIKRSKLLMSHYYEVSGYIKGKLSSKLFY